jgi:hypothetical protein
LLIGFNKLKFQVVDFESKLNLGLLTSTSPCHISHIYFDVNVILHHVDLGSITLNIIVILTNITCVDYVKMLPWGPNTCTFGWTFKRKLNVTIKKFYWISFLKRKISIIHLTNYINFNDANRWTGKKLWKIFYAISSNILNILVGHVEILCDMAKYSMASHGIFCHITCVVCSKINNGLLTLNVWVWSIKLLKIASCEDSEI